MGKEIWDAYREDGTLAGVDLVRGEELPEGLFHMVCEVIVRHKDGNYLLMQRDLHKETHPGEWESTAGGSALKGEDKWQCVKRELYEETGIVCDEFTEITSEVYYDKQCLFYCFYCEVDCDPTSVRFQEGETIGYRWVGEKELLEFRKNGPLVPGQKRRLKEFFDRKEDELYGDK